MTKRNLNQPPMDGNLLREIDYGLAVLSKMIKDNKREIKYLATNSQRIESYGGAVELRVLKNVLNIRNGVTELVNFLEISEMLIENIKSDMNDIWKARDVWQKKELGRLAQIEENRLSLQKAQIEKERIARKRAEKAAAKK